MKVCLRELLKVAEENNYGGVVIWNFINTPLVC